MLTIHAHNEEADKDVVKGVLVTLNHVMCITPPIDISEIDRLHRVGKPEANRTRPVLIKFATVPQQEASARETESPQPCQANGGTSVTARRHDRSRDGG